MTVTHMIGDLKGANRVEQAVQEHVEYWFPSYLRAVEQISDYNLKELPDFRSIETSPEFERWPEDQIPGLLIVSPGMIPGSVKVEGNGHMRAKFSVGLGVIVSADTKDNVNDLAKWYGIAIAALMVQKPSISGFARGTDLVNMSFDDLGSDGIRTQASALCIFEIEVPEIIDASKGLPAPIDDEEIPDEIIAEKTHVDVTPVATIGES